MSKIVICILVIVFLLFLLCACTTTEFVDVESGNVENVEVIKTNGHILKDSKKIFHDNICMAIADVTENEEKFLDTYNIDSDTYNLVTRYNFGNDLDYTNEIIFIPKDDSISYSLYSVSILEDGTIGKDQLLDDNINEPIRFKYDCYESIMPQYAIQIGDELIPIVYSGMDNSLALSAYKDIVVDLTIYNE